MHFSLKIFGIAAAAMALPTLAGAQDGTGNVTPSFPSDLPGKDISPDEWQSLVRGRTVTYKIGQSIWAQEAYDPRTNSVSIRLADGTCMDGIWAHADGEYCFAWTSGEYSCFRHLRTADEIVIVPVEDGAPTGVTQTVDKVSDIPLACGPALSS